MRKNLAFIVVLAMILAGCGDDADKQNATAQPAQPMPKPAGAQQPAAVPAPQSGAAAAAPAGALAIHADGMPVIAHDEDLNCVGCHQIEARLIGPAWREVANRYKGATTYKYHAAGSKDPGAKEYPLVDGLVAKVSNGGHGNWGTMPMPANDPSGKKKERIEKLVRFIVGLAK